VPASTQALQATLLLERAQRSLGKTAEADGQLRRAATLLEQVQMSPGERVNYLLTFAEAARDNAGKLQWLEQAQRVAERLGVEGVQPKIAEALAETALEQRNWVKAERALMDLVNAQEAKRERLAFDPLLRQQWFADNLSPYRRLLRVAAQLPDPLLALSCAERMRSRALTDQLAWRKVDMRVGLPRELAQRLEALRAMRAEAYGLLQRTLGASEDVLGDESRGFYIPIRGFYIPIRGPLAERKAVTEAEAARLKELLEQLAREESALESAIRESVPAYAMASQVQIPPGDQLAQAVSKQPGLAVLHYTLCDEGLALVGLRGGQPPQVVLVSETGDALREQVAKFRDLLWERKPEAATEAQALYTTLVAPMEELLQGAQRLWIVADGALQLIPFGALVGPDGRCLAQRLAMAYAPSLTLALARREAPREKATRSAVIVAAPDTGAVMPVGDDWRGFYIPIRGFYMPIRGEGGISSALTTMAAIPLPGARVEGDEVAKQFADGLLLSGSLATKQRLLQEGGAADIVHIATHGYADPEIPEFSGLLLAGQGEQPYEVLTAQEVYLWSLRARLVALSACQTGLGKDVEGEGLLGLTRAFIYAGAQDVLCSLWPVSDVSTAKLMREFYAALQKGASVEQALQQAQLALLADPTTSHPFYWAGFIAVHGPQ